MIDQETFLKIVRSAVKAPSGHNTQPWQFACNENSICITPDYRYALPVADPSHRELFISLGCAAETAMIAAGHYGYCPTLHLDPSGKVRIMLTPGRQNNESGLFSCIQIRQTNRSIYQNTPVDSLDLKTLKQSASSSSVSARIFEERAEKEKLVPYILQAGRIQFDNPAFKRELIQWMRFSRREALHKGDGLYSACSGVPSTGRIPGAFILKYFVTAGSEERRILKQIESTPVFIMFLSEADSIEQWVYTGMAFQRFALTASLLNLSHSFANSPCQVKEVRDRLRSELVLGNQYPQLIVRVGHSDPMPYSFRRNVYRFLSR